jgi:hypothetical protein
MKRGKPLRRKTPLRSRSKTKKYARRERDLDYMRKVRRLPCVVRVALKFGWSLENGRLLVATSCSGRVQADHMGTRAYGQKSHDRECAPACKGHHGERTDSRGAFKDWTKVEMRPFCDWAIEWTQQQVKEMDRGISDRW